MENALLVIVIYKLLLLSLTPKVSKNRHCQLKWLGLKQKVSSIKLHLAIEIFVANRNNLVKVQNMLVDSGYSGEKFSETMQKRWTVERTFA